jgi:hypothetical protein
MQTRQSGVSEFLGGTAFLRPEARRVKQRISAAVLRNDAHLFLVGYVERN